MVKQHSWGETTYCGQNPAPLSKWFTLVYNSPVGCLMVRPKWFEMDVFYPQYSLGEKMHTVRLVRSQNGGSQLSCENESRGFHSPGHRLAGVAAPDGRVIFAEEKRKKPEATWDLLGCSLEVSTWNPKFEFPFGKEIPCLFGGFMLVWGVSYFWVSFFGDPPQTGFVFPLVHSLTWLGSSRAQSLEQNCVDAGVAISCPTWVWLKNHSQQVPPGP